MKKLILFLLMVHCFHGIGGACPGIPSDRPCKILIFGSQEQANEAQLKDFNGNLSSCAIDYLPIWCIGPSSITDSMGNAYKKLNQCASSFSDPYCSCTTVPPIACACGGQYCYYYLANPPEDDCECENETRRSGQACANPNVGNPINIYSGNKKESETDLHFPSGFEKDFKVYRSYRSRSHMDSILGYGWTHNYNVSMMNLEMPFANAYVIVDEYNRLHYFQDKIGDGYHKNVLDIHDYLLTETDNTFTWRRANGVKYTFNQHLQYIAKEDGHGNVQTLTYNAAGRLSTVTDEATGRSIGFVYTPEGKVDRITGPVTDAVPDGVWVRYQYDSQGNLVRVQYADEANGSAASGFEYKYEDPNDPHNLTEKRNLAGEFLSSWTYDAQDRAIENITRDGKGVTIVYAGNQVRVTDADGVQKTYTIQNIDGQRTITDITGGGCASCGGDAVRYGYDEHRRVNEIEYANGRVDRFADFDADDRYHTEIQNAGAADERVLRYDYHPVTGDRLYIRETSLLGAGDKETVFDYDNDGNTVPNENPTRLPRRRIERGFTRNADGAVIPYAHLTAYTYNAKGQVLTVDGPLDGDQDKITYTYDPATGDRLTETRPLGGTTTYEYDDAGNPVRVTDINNRVTEIAYDGRNRQLTTTRDGVAAGRAYTAAGELAETTDALGRVLTYTYNAAGFLEKITDPIGDYLYYGYDDKGRRIIESIHAAGGARTHFRGADYGEPADNPAIGAGKPWKSLHYSPDGQNLLETTYAYDPAGNLRGVTDANNNRTDYLYDAFNRLTQVTQPGDTVTRYAYDSHGNLATVTDAEGHVTTYDYDDLGRLVQTDSPDTGTTVYSYDAAGNLRHKTQNGDRVEYRYDALGRLTHILYADPSQNVTLTYDSGSGANLAGRLASTTDASGVTTYSYDSEGRLIMETRAIDAVTYVTGYSYDAAGDLRAITYPTGQTVAYEPDPADPARIGGVRLDPGGANHLLAANIAYQPFGPVSTMTLGNTVALGKTFDLNYQLTDLTYTNGAVIMDRGYTADSVGNITAITDNLDPARGQSFGYDPLYRLTSADGAYGRIDYTYDKVGNRLSRARTGPAPSADTYAYYPGTNRLRTVTGTHAELIQYDADGNTVTRTPGAANPAPAVTDPADYTYNTNGQRIKKTNNAPKIFHYDQAGQLIAETTPAGAMLKAYVWLHGQPLAMLTPDGAVYYYHNDHLGAPQRLTNASAAVVWDADYLPFGKVDVRIESVENNLRFAGQYFDGETGLHYNYHRYYDPGVGRYLRADPIGLKAGVNLYTYVKNNPIILIDPEGLIDTVTTTQWACIKQAKGDAKKICKCFELLTSDPNFSSVCESCLSTATSLLEGIKKGKKPGKGDAASYNKCMCLTHYKKSKACCDCHEEYDNSIIKQFLDPTREKCEDCCP